jgi:hypothetical protein
MIGFKECAFLADSDTRHADAHGTDPARQSTHHVRLMNGESTRVVQSLKGAGAEPRIIDVVAGVRRVDGGASARFFSRAPGRWPHNSPSDKGTSPSEGAAAISPSLSSKYPATA